MVIEKNHEIVPFKQSKWLEKFINFKTQKRNLAKKDSEEGFYKFLNNSFYWKTLESLQTGLRLEIIQKIEYEEIIKCQSKLTFIGFNKSNEKCDSYINKKNEVFMDEALF